MRKIGIFGGTFNPPHKAHKRLACEMMKKANLSEMLIIPTFVPPHKIASDLAKSEDRLEMCKRTFFEDCFTVSDIEIRREGKSYTFDTLCELERLYKDCEFYLVVGSDMLLSFHKWYKYEDILKKGVLCAVSREGAESVEQLRTYAKEVLNLDEAKGEIIISEMPAFELSSTQIRKKLKDGESLDGLLTEETLSFIKEKELYK